MGAMGFEELKRIVDEAEDLGELAELPANVRSDALAKLVWTEWSEFWDRGPWHDSQFTLPQAKKHLINWIKGMFEGGEFWAERSDFHNFEEDSPELHLHQVLDCSHKFALASRYLHAFVVRGEPKLAYKKRADGDEYCQLTAGPLGAYDKENGPELD